MFRKKYEKFENKIEKHARARLSACRSVCLPKLAQDNPSYPQASAKSCKKATENTKTPICLKTLDGEDRVGLWGKSNYNSKVICS
jgi:hypothetical protein